MKVMHAIGKAWKLYSSRFGAMMAFLLLEVVLRLIVLTPALFLMMKGMELWALLCVPLFVLVTLPARQCAAEIMQEAVRGGDIFSVRLVVTRDYWIKVWNGLKQTLLGLVWMAPFLAATAYLVRVLTATGVNGQNDIFTLYRNIQKLGGGSLEAGAVRLLLMYAGLFVPFLVGCAFHSGRRHERALGPKKVIRGHRGGLMLTWLLSAVTVLPFAAATGWVVLGYVKKLISAVNNLAGGLVLPPLDQNIYLILGAFVVLLLPLLPLKSMMTACYVHDLWEGNE